MKKTKTLLALALAALMLFAVIGCTKIDVTEYTAPAATTAPAQSANNAPAQSSDNKTEATTPTENAPVEETVQELTTMILIILQKRVVEILTTRHTDSIL